MNNNNNPIITPILQRRKPIHTDNEQPQETLEEQNIAINTGNTVKIEFETLGRFSLPPILYFKDYTNKHVNDLILSSDDNLLETLLAILQENCISDTSIDLSLATLEELLEIVIGIKAKFDTTNHIHYWVCSCQNEKPDKEKIINETNVNLLELQYKSLAELDEEIKQYFAETFTSMTDEEFKSYLYKKYKNNPLDDIDSWTKEKELQTITIKEPFTFIDNDITYSFHYPRLRDILMAKKESERKFLPKIKMVQNRREANIPLHELKEKKEEEIKKIKEEQAKFLILYAKSLCLESINSVAIPDVEKYTKFSNDIPRHIIRQLDELLNILDFGLKTEISLECPICGSSERGLLREVLDIRQLLPYGDSYNLKRISSEGNNRIFAKSNFYFGI